MSAQLVEKQIMHDVILSAELSHYMTLDEMHERLTNHIRNAYVGRRRTA